MKKQLKLTAMLLTMALGALGVGNMRLIPLAGATYVEGVIAQDTVWTLVDSPFILSNDVTVSSAATLTIEPDVEVRFGGPFSLNVDGRLVANGTIGKKIRFTSSKIEPSICDWGAIRFSGPAVSSLVYCVIEYGTNGIAVGSGSLVIQKSLMQYNWVGLLINDGNVNVEDNDVVNNEIGVSISGGSVNIENNGISNNAESGILIVDCNQVNIAYNNIVSNENGVVLEMNSTSSINIIHNEILLNSGNGISLFLAAYGTLVITNNTVSGNLNGFQVVAEVSTYTTGNYISNNYVGLLYESLNSTVNHEARFNDICGNSFGISTTEGVAVNATHNYWGDPSGPYHVYLNPYGIGNQVGGDGTNVDFLFYLTASIDHLNVPPTPLLWTDKMLVAPNQEVAFIGIDSLDDGRVDQYFFDFGDGSNSGWTTLSIVNHTYQATPPETYVASLRVMDDFGAVSEITSNITIMVQDLAPLRAVLALSNETVNYTEETTVTVYVSNDTGPIENAFVELFEVHGGSFNPASGFTDANGYFTAVFTSPSVTQIVDVRIMARASMLGYADGSDHRYVKVLPPLMVEVSAQNSSVKSEATTIVTVTVSLGFRRPIEDAFIIMSCDDGTLSPIGESITNPAGIASFTFKAPQTLDQISVAIMAVAVREGYAEGQGQTSITVNPRLLYIESVTNPPAVLSEQVSTIVAHVTSDGIPVPAATVAAYTDAGELSASANETDGSGTAIFSFRAPRVTVREGLTANITLAAAKTGYVSAEAHAVVTVIAKTLAVGFTATTSETVSEGKVNVTVHVTSQQELNPVQEANVTFISESGGSFIPAFGLTDSYGNVTFEFTAPQVSERLLINITAITSKTGYITEEAILSIYVGPGTLALNVTTLSSSVASEEVAVIAVRVTCNESMVANVSVTISADYGSFANATLLTNLNGFVEFVYQAPGTDMQLPVVVLINASKFGFVSAGHRTDLAVTPAAAPQTGGGLPLATILLILVPIVIAIVVAMLLKLKVISISQEEED